MSVMSVVSCDCCNHELKTEAFTQDDAREVACEKGWVYNGIWDFCPVCIKKDGD